MLKKRERTEYFRRWYAANKEKHLANVRLAHKKLREEVFSHYGKACSCCREAILDFLCIDHIDGGGNEHRRSVVGGRGGSRFYAWLKRQGYPAGFQTLCHNCNFSRTYRQGRCVHKSQ